MLFSRRPTVAKLARSGHAPPPPQSDHPPVAKRHPILSTLFWLATIIGPAWIVGSMGDPITAAAWALVTASVWLGCRLGLVRSMIWIVIIPLCSVIATQMSPLVGSTIEPHLQALSPHADTIAMITIWILAAVAIVIFCNRPLYAAIARRRRLAACNAVTGGIFAGAQTFLILTIMAAAVLDGHDHPSANKSLRSLATVGQIDLDATLANAADMTRRSRLGYFVGHHMPTQKMASLVNLEKFESLIPQTDFNLSAGDQSIDIDELQQLLQISSAGS